MKRIRIVGLCLTAVFMLGVAVSSASAHGYKVVGGTLPEKVEGTSTKSVLEGKVLGTAITIECKKDIFSGTIEAGGASKGEIKFTECTVPTAAKCKVTEPIEFSFNDLLVGPEPGVEDEFKGVKENAKKEIIFVEITLTGAECLLKGSYPVKGTQTCKLPGGETPGKEHTIECTPAGSKLKLGTEEAKFTSTEKVKLTSGKEWSAM